MSSTLTKSNKEISQVFARREPRITGTPYNNQESTIKTQTRVEYLLIGTIKVKPKYSLEMKNT